MNLLEKFGFKDRSRNNRDQSIESGNEDYLLVYPKSVEDEVNRTISSLGFIDKDIPDGKSIDEIRKEYEDNKVKLKEIDNKLKKIKLNNVLFNMCSSTFYCGVADSVFNFNISDQWQIAKNYRMSSIGQKAFFIVSSYLALMFYFMLLSLVF